ncbi:MULTISPECIES: metal ABC transporter solute-binding protein, Zn/Mn family [Thermococcus]|uniref:ABC transporter, periplasmic binding protein n=2 Tax=Thermococcus sibiricus TaxID=172049 RepID=C6A0V1_THESM|nr:MULTISPECIES: zinc ABC transporter substrate-binding protein [Thermococcus]ACS89246.1 ABC transporter, periplasmic binding protein [Thermococcus sibiricus MM 739]KUK17097.1 MAG: ABC transporter, periplasmic binding protein [Thermococcus sibiricus]MBC7095980.1 zinc ABC transporter substrate-binding protein [Thermococcus sp.]
MRKMGLILIIFLISPLSFTLAQEKPLVITSIAPIAEIVREAFGESVQVEYLVPPSVDPHQYQLTPEQIEKIQKADVILTIAHLPVEEKIEELEKEGVLKGKILEIEDYQRHGFRYLPERWYNNKYNPHGIWLDPYNALAIAETTKESLKTRYSGKNIFDAQYSLFKAKVETIILAYQKMNLSEKQAIIELPSQQYALEWMGIEVIASIKPEEEIPAKSVDELLEMAKTVDVIVYSVDSPESLKNAALELSRKTGVPAIEVSTIWSEKEYTEVLIQNSANIVSAFRTYIPQEVPSQQSLNTTYIILVFIVGVTLGTAFGVIIKK